MADTTTTTTPDHHPSYPPQQTPSTDLVLRSKDGVLFHVHSTILSVSSSVFQDMFTIQRPASERPDDPIDISESANVISTLLDLIYPNKPNPEIPTLVHLFDVATAAEKYDMQGVFQSLQAYILLNGTEHSAEYHCVAAYSVSRRFGWTKATMVTAKASLAQPLSGITTQQSLGDNLPLLDVVSLVQMQDWHKQRSNIVSETLDTITGSYMRAMRYYEDLSWEALHMDYYDYELMVRDPEVYANRGHNDSCVTFSWDPDETGYMHGDKWDKALQEFKARVKSSLEMCPSGDNLRLGEFWEKWELEGFECKACKQVMVRKPRLRIGLLQLIDDLPEYPGHERVPRRDYRRPLDWD